MAARSDNFLSSFPILHIATVWFTSLFPKLICHRSGFLLGFFIHVFPRGNVGNVNQLGMFLRQDLIQGLSKRHLGFALEERNSFLDLRKKTIPDRVSDVNLKIAGISMDENIGVLPELIEVNILQTG